MNAKHTPGPWESSRIDDENGKWIGNAIGQSMNIGGLNVALTVGIATAGHVQANAALIARAPDLLAENERLTARCARLEAALKQTMIVTRLRQHSETCICTACEDSRAALAAGKTQS